MVYAQIEDAEGSLPGRVQTSTEDGIPSGSVTVFIEPHMSDEDALMKAIMSFERFQPQFMLHLSWPRRLALLLRPKHLRDVYETWRIQRAMPEIHRKFCEKHGLKSEEL